MQLANKDIVLVSLLLRVKNEECGLLVAVAFMGAPVIISEKLVNGNETTLCIETMQRILASGRCIDQCTINTVYNVGLCTEECGLGKIGENGVVLSKKCLENGNEAWFVDVSDLPQTSCGDTNIPLVSFSEVLSFTYTIGEKNHWFNIC